MTDDHATERFTFAGWVWDVTAAHTLVAGRPSRPVAMDPLRSYLALGLVRVDPEYAMTTDLTRPLILARLPGTDGTLPIDGWHRIYHAIHDNIAELPGVALTDAEGDQVRTQLHGRHATRPTPPVRRPTAADQVRAGTASGRLPAGAVRQLVAAHLDDHPGQSFTIGELARVLGIANAPVRDAVRHLVAENRATRIVTRSAAQYTTRSQPTSAP